MARRLGQHFLRDPAILDRIVDALDPHPDDGVLEIGPGEGTLTRRLAPRVGRVLAIEKDARLAARLQGEGRHSPLPDNVTVAEGDALNLDWHQMFPLSPFPFPPKIIGNIPYNITSPLIEKALTPPFPAVIVFLVQKEVAERVTAVPGTKAYGALSVGVQAVARAERLFTVKAGAFAPPPKVDSAVLRLTPLAHPLVNPTEQPAFRSFVVGLFGQRRKQLGRSLRDVARVDKDTAEQAIRSAGLDPAQRVETVLPADLVRLSRLIVPPLPKGAGDRG
jgi:16S rRNA (adenine1518-N6/adenine1519-N6)-dimethyltransferase